jgi:N-acetylmuramic acid 6-phosphate (MurNAc-6-P) etherase
MGRITMSNAALVQQTNVVFRLNNTTISDNDVVLVSISGGVATPGSYWPYVADQETGYATIGLFNNTSGSLSESVVVNFVVIHGAS